MASLPKFAYIVFPVLLPILWLLRTALRAGLRDLPGPFIAKFSNLWNLRNVASGKAEVGYRKLHQKYGPIVRTGPNHIAISDPEAIPIIYSIHSKFTKSDFYTVFSGKDKNGEGLHDLFTEADPAIHKSKKRNLTNAYAMTSMVSMEALVDECAKLFLQKLDQMQDGPVDLGSWLQWYAFDVIGQITFSKRFGFMEQGEDIQNMIKKLEWGLAYSAMAGQYPKLHKYLLLGSPLTMWLFKQIPSLANGNPVMFFQNFSEQQVQMHIEKPTPDSATTKDFLTRVFEQQKSQGERFSDQDVVVSCMTNLMAGSDTTAISLRAVIYMLIKNPRCYQKLQKEIDDLDSQGKLSPLVTFNQSLNMPYLQACIKEAMRLHPGVGLPLERIVPKGGATLCGHAIPEGTVVGMNAWVTHLDKNFYGKDAAEFRPERWIESDEETLKIMNRSILTFGQGSRSCIGKNISILEMSKLIPQLLRYYTITMAVPDQEWKTENWWFVKQSGLICKIASRTKIIKY